MRNTQYVCACGGKFKTRGAVDDHIRKHEFRAKLDHHENKHVFAYKQKNGTIVEGDDAG